MKHSNRTVWFTLFLAVLVVGASYLLRESPTVAGYALMALAFLSLPVAARHSVADLAVGGGLKGVWRTLTTEQKPPALEPPKG